MYALLLELTALLCFWLCLGAWQEEGAASGRRTFVCIALAVWGFLLPVIYARFGSQFSALLNSGLLPREFANFGGGDVFSLPGSIALSFIHPIAIILISVFAIGFSAAAVAGEREQGTLEVALARPVSRQSFYFTLLMAAWVFVATTIADLDDAR